LAVPAVLVPASPTWAITAAGPDAPPNSIRGINGPILLAQDEGGDNSEVTPAEIEKYVAVYRAMHRDRSLTVEQAAAQQGMTVAAFRSLENRVQRDDAALQHARDELQASAVHASTPASPIPGGTKR
jgi:hypothetical protein